MSAGETVALSEDPILSVVTTFIQRRPDGLYGDLLMPDLAERDRIIREVPRSYRVVDYHADIRDLSLVSADPVRAVCICDARLRLEMVEEDQSLPSVWREVMAGRVDLVKTDDSWKPVVVELPGRDQLPGNVEPVTRAKSPQEESGVRVPSARLSTHNLPA